MVTCVEVTGVRNSLYQSTMVTPIVDYTGVRNGVRKRRGISSGVADSQKHHKRELRKTEILRN